MQRAWCVYMGISFVQPSSSQPLSENVGHWLQTHYRRGELGCNSQQFIGRCSIGEPLSNDAQLQRQSWIYFNIVNLGMERHGHIFSGASYASSEIVWTNTCCIHYSHCRHHYGNWSLLLHAVECASHRIQMDDFNTILPIIICFCFFCFFCFFGFCYNWQPLHFWQWKRQRHLWVGPGRLHSSTSFFSWFLTPFFRVVQSQGLQPQSPDFQLPESPWETGTQSDACTCI